MKLNKDKIEKLVIDKYISKVKHPDVDLWILNYSPICQFEGFWTEETLMCRGLIIDSEYNVIQRPFKKFFNYDDSLNVGELPSTDFEVWEKLDGSLGILYWVNDKPFIATRGSFSSDQAIEGTNMFNELNIPLSRFDRSKTYLFEIIYPSNRIVVDYKDQRTLYLIAIIDTETGIESTPTEDFGFPIPKLYDFHSFDEFPKDIENSEGFVLKWRDGYRVKFKFEEYKRLHKIITGVSEKTIWEMLRDNKPIDELIDKVPDEFYEWVKDRAESINNSYSKVETDTKNFFEGIQNLESRKDFALKAKEYKYPNLLFDLYDNHEEKFRDSIFKLIKPASNKPFKEEEL